jgi:hypothetical protein
MGGEPSRAGTLVDHCRDGVAGRVRQLRRCRIHYVEREKRGLRIALVDQLRPCPRLLSWPVARPELGLRWLRVRWQATLRLAPQHYQHPCRRVRLHDRYGSRYGPFEANSDDTLHTRLRLAAHDHWGWTTTLIAPSRSIRRSPQMSAEHRLRVDSRSRGWRRSLFRGLGPRRPHPFSRIEGCRHPVYFMCSPASATAPVSAISQVRHSKNPASSQVGANRCPRLETYRPVLPCDQLVRHDRPAHGS